MARGGARGGGRGGRKQSRNNNKNHGGRARDTRTEPWSDIKRENDLFEAYYQQGGFLDEAEFEQMWKTLATDLPNSFRFTGTKSDALAVREIFKQRYIPSIAAQQFEGKPVQPPEPVKAFPDELVWHMKTHKKIIRRHAPFALFQKFLVAETTSGNISRQEVVSMIPPHFLDVKPGMVVLDMCAAPGSKSAQLAEMIHGDEEERVRRAANGLCPDEDDGGDYSDDGRSTGLLIANDTDYKRAGMLVHQVKRLNFPNLIVTQHDAAIFPSIELPSEGGQRKRYLKYDRILADVPCSGDGTARKNANVWQKWTPKDALGLHNLQLRILFRGLQMLKKGGRLVYSTCSMNPVENEAVVAAAINACGGTSKVELVDVSDHLPDLKRKPGMNEFQVFDTSSVGTNGEKIAHMFSSWELFSKAKNKYAAEEPERQFSNKMAPSLFPPISDSPEERIPLERCVRVYPHLQDTGGFFIAVLKKVDDIKATQIKNATNEAEARKAKPESDSATPITAVTPNEEEVKLDVAEGQTGDDIPDIETNLKRKLEEPEELEEAGPAKRTKTQEGTECTGIDLYPNEDANSAPNESTKPKGLGSTTNDSIATIARATEDTKLKPENQNNNKEYFEYLSPNDPTIASILDFFGISKRFPRDRFMVKNKEGLLLNKIYYTSELAKTIIAQNKERGMKFVHCGVVMFVSHKIKDKGTMKAPWRLQGEGIRILEPWASNRIITCTSKDTFHRMLIEMFPKLPKDGSHEIGEIGDQLNNMEIGCCFMRIEKDESKGFPFRMVLPVWRHPGSANLMVDKDDRKAMLLRFFNEQNPEIINHVAEKAAREAQEAKGDGISESDNENKKADTAGEVEEAGTSAENVVENNA